MSNIGETWDQEDVRLSKQARLNFQEAAGHYIRPGMTIDEGILEMGRLLREKDATIANLRAEIYKLRNSK